MEQSAYMPNRPNGDESDRPPVHGENILIKVTTVCAIFASFGVGIWWAAQLSADVRGVQRDVQTIRQAVGAIDKISSLEAELSELRRYGSLNSQQTSKDLDQLRRDFEMHKATTMIPAKQ